MAPREPRRKGSTNDGMRPYKTMNPSRWAKRMMVYREKVCGATHQPQYSWQRVIDQARNWICARVCRPGVREGRTECAARRHGVRLWGAGPSRNLRFLKDRGDAICARARNFVPEQVRSKMVWSGPCSTSGRTRGEKLAFTPCRPIAFDLAVQGPLRSYQQFWPSLVWPLCAAKWETQFA